MIKAYGAIVNSGTANLIAIEQGLNTITNGAIRRDITQTLSSPEIIRVLANIKQVWEHISTTDVTVAVPYVDLLNLSAYRNLRLTITYAQTSAGNLYFRFGSSGTPNASSTYVLQVSYGSGSSSLASETVSATNGSLTFGGSATTSANWADAIAHVSHFNKPLASRVISNSGVLSGSGRFVGTYVTVNTNEIAWDMMRMFPAAGNIGVGSRFILEGVRG